MHAVVSNVSIQAGQFETARKMLSEEVVPRIRKAPGFVKGYWTVSNDSTQGTSMTIFQTKQQAESALAMIRSANPPHGVTLNSVEVREVVAEA
jgi:prophage antirepressor-like protein